MTEMAMAMIFWNARITFVFNLSDLSASLKTYYLMWWLQKLLQEGIVRIEEDDAWKGNSEWKVMVGLQIGQEFALWLVSIGI